MKDSGNFTIPVSIGGYKIGQALCDLGASINLMSLSVYKRLGVREVRPTTVTLQLANHSIANPEGKIEGVLVQVDKFIFLADFIVLDFDAGEDVPIILWRPFLATGRTLVDVHKGKVTMRVQDQEIKFSIYDSMKYPSDAGERAVLRVLDEAVLKSLSAEAMLEKQNGEVDTVLEQADEICQEILYFDCTSDLARSWSRVHESLVLEDIGRKQLKTSIEETPELVLKAVPKHMKYAYLGASNMLPIIIVAYLIVEKENELLQC
ncbi:uncharacterized protein LOC111013378 [Momordica charantia]|uniref:Uncharacterized protein LOC111013378 n=1 Tax=Momordica charantia TaxID=3673 RepID=A0A6J1CNZ2_MOMCH|nr:uncharacterized protein LOC111013378 [Momordica charantia]